MRNLNDNGGLDLETVISVFVCLVVIATATGVHGCRAATQAAVYRREGIEMSTWEVFIGCQPAERTINLK